MVNRRHCARLLSKGKVFRPYSSDLWAEETHRSPVSLLKQTTG